MAVHGRASNGALPFLCKLYMNLRRYYEMDTYAEVKLIEKLLSTVV